MTNAPSIEQLAFNISPFVKRISLEKHALLKVLQIYSNTRKGLANCSERRLSPRSKIYVKAHTNWLNCRQNFENEDLSGLDLSGLNLSSINLRNANLSECNVKETNFHEANLSRADLRNIYAKCAYFVDANLSEVDLSGAFLLGATFRDPKSLDTAKMSGAKTTHEDIYKK
jgi:uncharacterized protein YjbI with pentapeptide repeats